jgi:hypothetical protein
MRIEFETKKNRENKSVNCCINLCGRISKKKRCRFVQLRLLLGSVWNTSKGYGYSNMYRILATKTTNKAEEGKVAVGNWGSEFL